MRQFDVLTVFAVCYIPDGGKDTLFCNVAAVDINEAISMVHALNVGCDIVSISKTTETYV